VPSKKKPGRPPTEGVGTTVVSITVLPEDWRQFKVNCVNRGTTMSYEIRKFIKRELEKARVGR
jgi:hypothetical protein